jgi:cold shock CspA family protein/ribosome-associated translation inhibitor RaiA
MILPVQVTFRNISQLDGIEAMVREEAARLDEFYNHIMGCRVMIEVPHRHHEEGDHYHVRVDLTVPGGEIVVKREPSLHARQQNVREVERKKEWEIETSRKHLEVAVREAFETTRRKLQDYARRQRADVKSHEGNPSGRVVRVFPEEGYGFIESQDGYEVYFHKNSVLDGDFDHVEVGSEVTFAEEEGLQGPQASSVRLVGSHRHHKVVMGIDEQLASLE